MKILLSVGLHRHSCGYTTAAAAIGSSFALKLTRAFGMSFESPPVVSDDNLPSITGNDPLATVDNHLRTQVDANPTVRAK